MPHLAIIGIGSPFGDDQAGWRVVDALAESMSVAAYGERVLVAACRSPAGELPELLVNADVAIVVDAVRGDGAPGTVYRISGGRLPPFVSRRLSSHGIDLQTLFELTAALEYRPRERIVYGIESGAAGVVGTAMNESVRRAAEWVAENIKRDMAYFCMDKPKRINFAEVAV